MRLLGGLLAAFSYADPEMQLACEEWNALCGLHPKASITDEGLPLKEAAALEPIWRLS